MTPNSMCGFLPARVALALLCSTGVIFLYMVRINLSVAIVAMVHVPSTNNVTREKLCVDNDVESHSLLSNSSLKIISSELQIKQQPPEKIIMTATEKGSVLGSFYYGYVTTAILGGRMSEVYGSKRILTVCMLIGGILTLLTPVAANTHYALFTAVRIIIGMSQGGFYPSLHILTARWIPPLERPRFMSFVYISNCLGIVITMPLCGVLIDAVGWPWVFYVSGILCLAWVVVWVILMHDTPQEHPRISQAELKYITDALTEESNKGTKPSRVPWVEILRSRGLWAITICHTGNVWGWNLLNSQLPSYMDGVLGLSIKKNALVSAIPFLCRFIASNCWSWMGDTLNTKGILSTRVTRRLFSAIGLIGMGVVLAIVGFLGCNVALVVFALSVGTTCLGATVAGYGANMIDLAPNFAGTLLGVTNTFGFFIGMLSPVVVGALTPDDTPEQWQVAFLSASGILLVGITIYLIFADTNVQPWNFASPEETQDGEEERNEFIKKNAQRRSARNSQETVTYYTRSQEISSA